MASSKEEVKIYIDTNIWVGYANSALFKGVKYPKCEKIIDLLLIIEKKKVSGVFSYFNLIELTKVLSDTIVNLRLLGEGYSVFELTKTRKEKKLTQLTKKEEESLAQLLAKLTSFKFLKTINTESPEALDEQSMYDLLTLTSGFLEMPDALHILFAMKNGCNRIITNDKPFITDFREAQRKYKEFKKIRIQSPEDSIEELLHHP